MKIAILSVLLASWALPAFAASSPAAPAGGSGFPTEVVVKGEGVNKLDVSKPALNIEVDPFETIHSSLKPDQSLLLSGSPASVSWRRTHPEFLNNRRVIQPWRLTFSQRLGIPLRVRDQLFTIIGRKLDPKEAKAYAWNLTIADESGRVFQHYESSSDPPEEILWSGQNEQGEWMRAGRSYSAVYAFTDSSGARYTGMGRPLLFKGILHQEETGLYLTLDSGVLFGHAKNETELVQPAGLGLLRSAADVIKRRFTGIPVAVRVFADSKTLAETQGAVIQGYLVKELMTMSKNVSMEGARAEFSEQRVEIVLLNR